MWRHNLVALFHLLIDQLPDWLVRSDGYVAFRRRLSQTPRRYEATKKAARPFTPGEWKERKLATASTDLVIEGFPGSGNTFVSNTVREHVDGPCRIESHFHYTAQLRRALAFGVPAIVIVRQPLDACRSLQGKEPALFPSLILWRWLLYHRFVLRHAGRLEVFLFDDVIHDIDLVRRECSAVQALVDRPLTANLEHRRASATPPRIDVTTPLRRALLRRAATLYEKFSTRGS